ncbi:MAG: hypothetical protein DRN71_05240 [Candidatus Nanohalarchaeota archaeon]|nr:MAG: hypothetical protein DRN71_05240 [Candidatus Nanohaloarchaeota archaeon]
MTMTDNAEIEKWIRDELNRGYDSETVKLQLKQNGYKPSQIDGLVDLVAKEKDANNQAESQDTTHNLIDNTYVNPQMQYGSQNNPETPNRNSAQTNQNENSYAQNPTNTPRSNSSPNPTQTAKFQNMGFIEKAKMIFLNPKGFFDIMPQTGGYKDPIIFLSIIYVIFSIFTSLIAMVGSDSLLSGVIGLVISPVIVLIIVIPLMFLMALIYHILLKIVGGNGTYESTFKVIAYSSVPALLSWIPYVGWVLGFYQLYIVLTGYSKVHNISALRVLMVLLIPVIILIIIFIILLVIVGASLFSVFSNMEPPTGAIISYLSSGN